MAGPSRRKKFDWKYFKTPTGILVFFEGILSSFAFFICLTQSYYIRKPPGTFFILVTFVVLTSSIFWSLIHFCEVKSSRWLRNVNWGIVSLVYSGMLSFITLVASSLFLDMVFYRKAFRAASIFGFLTFVCLLIHFLYELRLYLNSNKGRVKSFTAAIISNKRGNVEVPEESSTNEDPEDPVDSGVTGVIRIRPTSVYEKEEGWTNQSLVGVEQCDSTPAEEAQLKEDYSQEKKIDDYDDSSLDSDDNEYNFVKDSSTA